MVNEQDLRDEVVRDFLTMIQEIKENPDFYSKEDYFDFAGNILLSIGNNGQAIILHSVEYSDDKEFYEYHNLISKLLFQNLNTRSLGFHIQEDIKTKTIVVLAMNLKQLGRKILQLFLDDQSICI